MSVAAQVVIPPPPGGPVRATPATLAAEAFSARAGIVLVAAALFVFLTAPLIAIFARATEDKQGGFVGLANFAQYVTSPAFARSAENTLIFAGLTTLVTVPLAFAFAYAIQRSCIRAKWLWRNIALVPILAPSMLAALSFIYLFGNQGVFKALLPWFGLTTIYGMPGMVLAMTLLGVPARGDDPARGAVAVGRAPVRGGGFARHLGVAQVHDDHAAGRALRPRLGRDGRVHDGRVRVRRAQGHRRQHNVLAIDIYKQVIGQQNFNIGAVVGLILLVPGARRRSSSTARCARRQKALLSARSVAYVP